MNFDPQFRLDAYDRWFQPEEIFDILHNFADMGFIVSTEPPSNPKSGELYIYDRIATSNFKSDGINWVKKLASNRIREDFVKLSVKGTHLITGLYTFSTDDQRFKRRSYRLTEGSSYTLVHYRYCSLKEISSQNNHRTNQPQHISEQSRPPFVPPTHLTYSEPSVNYSQQQSWDNSQINAQHPITYGGNNAGNVMTYATATATGVEENLTAEELASFLDWSEDMLDDDDIINNNDGDMSSSFQTALTSSPNTATSISASNYTTGQIQIHSCPPRIGEYHNNNNNNNSSGSNSSNNNNSNNYNISNNNSSNSNSHMFPQDHSPHHQPLLTSYPTHTHTHSFHTTGHGASTATATAHSSSESSLSMFLWDRPIHGNGHDNDNGNGNGTPSPTDISSSSQSQYTTSSQSNRMTGDGAPGGGVAVLENNPSPSGINNMTVSILDFSPEVDAVGGGVKVLICLSGPIAARDLSGIKVFFGWQRVDAQLLTPTTLKVYTPNLAPGKYSLAITNAAGTVLAPPSSIPFEYRQHTVPMIPSFNGNNNDNNNVNINGTMNTLTSSSFSSDSYNHHMESVPAPVPAPVPLPSRPYSLLHSVSTTTTSSNKTKRKTATTTSRNKSSEKEKENIGIDIGEAVTEQREHKVRMVERHSSGSITTANETDAHISDISEMPTEDSGDNKSQTQSQSQLVDGTGDEDWLEDSALSTLRPSDLSSIMDHVLLNVVRQLVQFASSDEELKTELDSLDDSGFSLLHYCSLYNLELLVPVVLSKGGNVNRLTRCGTTALHLAAGGGHLAVIKVLLEHGAQCSALDSYGLTPLDRALQANMDDVVTFLNQADIGGASATATATLLSVPSSSSSVDGIQDSVNERHGSSLCRVRSNSQGHIPPVPISIYKTASTDGAPFSASVPDGGDTSTSITSSPQLTARAPDGTESTNTDSKFTSLSPGSSAVDADIRANALLYDAFSSLSLADKCAFSLSLSQSGEIDLLKSFDVATEDFDGDFDVKSVLSESDKESLDVAMSMMTNSELSKVESEVRVIQNNVRAWLLRKNYTNLREAALVLQTAWRHRRSEHENSPRHLKPGATASTAGTGTGTGTGTHVTGSTMDKRSLDSNKTQSPSALSSDMSIRRWSSSPVSIELDDNGSGGDNKITAAAATLQAATRGMLARKSFESIKKQAVASLVIQKSLMAWWQQKGLSVSDSIDKKPLDTIPEGDPHSEIGIEYNDVNSEQMEI